MGMTKSNQPALSLSGIFKSYGKVQALDNLSFDVAAGRFFVLFGPSSVGKTTTLRIIAGLVHPDSGRLEINGKDFTREPILGRGVSMVFQSFALYPHLTVFENLAYPLREEKAATSEITRRVNETATMLKLSHRLERKPNTLSGGEQQRVALGRSLIRQPKILLLDEPNAHLDIAHQIRIFNIIKKLNVSTGLTVISVSHDLNLAAAYSDRIGMLVCGSLLAMGSPNNVLTKENIESVFRADVLVDRHPTINSPRVTLLTSN